LIPVREPVNNGGVADQPIVGWVVGRWQTVSIEFGWHRNLKLSPVVEHLVGEDRVHPIRKHRDADDINRKLLDDVADRRRDEVAQPGCVPPPGPGRTGPAVGDESCRSQ
jgi:hypothetical protein